MTRIVSSLPHSLYLSTAQSDLFYVTMGATAVSEPTGGWNGSPAVRFTPPNMYPPPYENGNQGYAGLGNIVLAGNPQVLFARWLVYCSPDYFLSSRWSAEPSQKHFIARRLNGADGSDRVMVNFHEYMPGEFDVAVCNGIDCAYPTTRFPLHTIAGQWACIEVEANLVTGIKNLWITTEDGVYTDHLVQTEALVPGSSSWSDIDFIGFFNGPIDTTIPGMYFKLSNVALSEAKIGAPVGFGSVVPPVEPPIDPPVVPPVTPPAVLSPVYNTGGRNRVLLDTVEISNHTLMSDAYDAAEIAIRNNPASVVSIVPDVVRVTLE